MENFFLKTFRSAFGGSASKLVPFAALALAVCAPQSARAAKNWTGSSSGNWATSSNWSGNGSGRRYFAKGNLAGSKIDRIYLTSNIKESGTNAGLCFYDVPEDIGYWRFRSDSASTIRTYDCSGGNGNYNNGIICIGYDGRGSTVRFYAINLIVKELTVGGSATYGGGVVNKNMTGHLVLDDLDDQCSAVWAPVNISAAKIEFFDGDLFATNANISSSSDIKLFNFVADKSGGEWSAAQTLYIGYGANQSAEFRNHGGSLSVGQYGVCISGADGCNKEALFLMDGGSMLISGGSANLSIGDRGAAGSSGVFRMSGGDVVVEDVDVRVGSMTRGQLTMTGGSIVAMNGGLVFCRDSSYTSSKGDSRADLNGGTIEVGGVTYGSGSGKATLAFNGGTLKARKPGVLVKSHANLSVIVGDGGASIDTSGYTVTNQTGFAAETGASAPPLQLRGGGKLVVASGKYGITGRVTLHMDSGTCLAVGSAQDKANALADGVTVHLPSNDILPGVYPVFETYGSGVTVTGADLAKFSFASAEQAQQMGAQFELSADGKAVLVRLQGSNGIFVWTGAGDGHRFSDPLNWRNGVAPVSGTPEISIGVQSPSVLWYDVAGARPKLIAFEPGSELVTITGSVAIVGTTRIINAGAAHHVLKTKVVIDAGTAAEIPIGAENYVDFQGGLEADSFAQVGAQGGEAVLKGSFTIRQCRDWDAKVVNLYRLLGDASAAEPVTTLMLPNGLKYTSSGKSAANFIVEKGAQLICGNSLGITSTTDSKYLLRKLDGDFWVFGDIVVQADAEKDIVPSVEDGSGWIHADGLVSNKSGKFQLANAGTTMRWSVGANGMSGAESANFWLYDGNANNRAVIRAEADIQVSILVVATPGASGITFETTGSDGAPHTITMTGGLSNGTGSKTGPGKVFVTGSGRLVCTGFDEPARSANSEVNYTVRDTATLAVQRGSKLGKGGISVEEGAALEIFQSDLEGGALIGGALSVATGATLRFVEPVLGVPQISVADFSVSGNGPATVAVDGEALGRGDYTLVAVAADATAEDIDRLELSGTAIAEGDTHGLLIVAGDIVLSAANPVVSVGNRDYATIASAIAASSAEVPAVLKRYSAETVTIPEGETLHFVEGDFLFDGKFAGKGAVRMTAPPKAYSTTGNANGPTLFDPGWTGTFQIAWTTTGVFVMDDFGTPKSRVELACDFGGFVGNNWTTDPPGIVNVGTHLSFDTAWTINNGWQSTDNKTVVASISGAGTMLLQGSSAGTASIYYEFTTVTNFTGLLGGGVRRRANFSFGDIRVDNPQFGVPLVKLDANASVNSLDTTMLNGQVNGAGNVYIAKGVENGQDGIYLARAVVVFDEVMTPYVSIEDALAAAEAAEVAEVTVLDGSSSERAGWDYSNGRYTRYIAGIAVDRLSDSTKFANLSRAVAAADSSEDEKYITLLGQTSENVTIQEDVTLDCGSVAYNGTVSGAGTVKVSRKPSQTMVAADWSGRFVVDWEGGFNSRVDVNSYGNAGSVVEITRLEGGFLRDGYNGPDLFVVDPVIDVSGYMTLNNYFPGKSTFIPVITGEGTVVFDNCACDVGEFRYFTGTFSTTNSWETDDMAIEEFETVDHGVGISNILTASEVKAGVCFLKTSPTTFITNLTETTVNGISTNLMLIAKTAQPGVYIPMCELVEHNAQGGEVQYGLYAFLVDAVDASGDDRLVSLLADTEEYVMHPGETIRVRDNGYALSLSAPENAEIKTSVDELYPNSILYSCVSTLPDMLYSVTADGVLVGDQYTDGASAFEAAFAADGSVIVVKVEAGEDVPPDGDLGATVAQYFVHNQVLKTYTMYRDNNDVSFNVLAEDVQRIRDAGVENPTAMMQGLPMSYAQAAALGLLTIDGLSITAEPFRITSIRFVDGSRVSVTTNGQNDERYSIGCTLIYKDALSDEWNYEGIDKQPLGIALTDPGAGSSEQPRQFYKVIVTIRNN